MDYCLWLDADDALLEVDQKAFLALTKELLRFSGCCGCLPCIQLCVCYSRLGDPKRAEAFNELAASFKPDSPAVLHNRSVFQALSEQTA